ncbi:MAG: MATE family efflux transporter [Oscillospiraceae bacterium]|jgi:putative MATE family efflux protein|nr:MATE family efflux transporter [Oscillospiraceae bacterium]
MLKSATQRAGSFIQALSRPVDMTEGAPWIKILRFSIPLLIGNVIQQLYAAIDAAVLGRYVGVNALAAVGASFPLLNLLLVLFMGVSTGATILAAQYFGARDRDRLSETVGVSITLMLLVSAAIMALGPVLTEPLLRITQTPPEVSEGSAAYLKVCFMGILGIAFYNMLAGILRGLGDVIMPLLFLTVACVTNIALDLYFVAALDWGVAGAAWATVISQIISGALCLLRLSRMRSLLVITRGTLRLRRGMSIRLLRLGMPAGVTQMVFAMASLLVQSLTNSFGAVVIACSTVVMRVDGFAMMPNFTFGNAMTTYAGQNVGAGSIDRTRKGAIDGLWISSLFSAVMTIAILLGGRWMMEQFTNDPEVIRLGVRMLRILAVGYVAMAISQALGGVMRGAGDTVTPMWLSIVSTIVLRMPIAYAYARFTQTPQAPNGSPDSLYVSLLVAWVLGAALTAIMYRYGRWRKTALAASAE